MDESIRNLDRDEYNALIDKARKLARLSMVQWSKASYETRLKWVRKAQEKK